MRIDHHTHSTASDGLLTPSQLVRRAHREGVQVLALTDHESLAGRAEAARSAQRAGMTFIPGIELAFTHAGRELHLVGLGVRRASASLRRVLTQHTRARAVRLIRTVTVLQAAGYTIDERKVRRLAKGQIGRPHIAQALLEEPTNRQRLQRITHAARPTVSSVIAALMAPGAPTYVPRWMPTARTAIGAIHASGGIAVLAHARGLAGISLYRVSRWQSIVTALVRSGIDGIEVYAYAQNKQDRRALRTLARRHNLLITGGSDYHSERMHAHQRIGFAMSGLPLDVDTMTPPTRWTMRSLRLWLEQLRFRRS